jgi:hypothetical protein
MRRGDLHGQILAHARAVPSLRVVELRFTLRRHCGIVAA